MSANAQPRAGAYRDSDGHFGVAVRTIQCFVKGEHLVAEMTADEMVLMAEHLLTNARSLRERTGRAA